tara:strand:- start:483 stop:995 length:513 start_codon:yes stop_codon:yes gene_type:complete
MAVDKNFVVKNGIEVNSNLIIADANTKKVGIGSTGPRTTLDVRGGIAATDGNFSGIITALNLNVSDNTTLADVNVTGVITSTAFSGDGSGLTGVASTDNIQTATPANFLNNVNVTGVITATTFSGDGSGLVGILTATTFLVVGRSTNTNVPVSGNTFTIEGRSGNVIVPI